jgi:hypothetical protein
MHAHDERPGNFSALLVMLFGLIVGAAIDRWIVTHAARPLESTASPTQNAKPDAAELLAGGRQEWVSADSKTRHAAIGQVLVPAHPEWDELTRNFNVGFLCGRIDLIYEQPNTEQLAKTIIAIEQAAAKEKRLQEL